MTEAKWLAATDPGPMLTFLRGTGTATDRKLRLFAVACCRAAWDLLGDPRSGRGVEVAEMALDWLTSQGQMEATAREAEAAWKATKAADGPNPGVFIIYTAEAVALLTHWGRPAAEVASGVACLTSDTVASRRQTDFLRDIFGNPYRPLPPIAPSLQDYNDRLVFRLAKASYDDRLMPCGHLDPSRLAILADALLDSGCSPDDDALLHLRGEGPHWRGCWAVDTVMGRE
jgi:hypothetical protein